MSEEYLKHMAEDIAAAVVAAIGTGTPDRQLLTLTEAQEQLKISRRSFQKLTRDDRAIPVLVVGDGAKRVRQADIDAYLSTRVEGASS